MPPDLDTSSALAEAPSKTSTTVLATVSFGPMFDRSGLRIAARPEQLLPWADRRPPTVG